MEGGDHSLVFSGKNCCLSSLCQHTVKVKQPTQPYHQCECFFGWLFPSHITKPSQSIQITNMLFVHL